MVTDKMRAQYDNYLHEHIRNVKTAISWIQVNLPEWVSMYDAETLAYVGIMHDLSKWEDEEYDAYVEYFNGEQTDDVKSAFDAAWLHHQHNNQHHWQHWVLREDDGNTKAIQMPHLCILEMLSDWWSFSWKNNNLYEIFDWYDENKSKIVLHNDTRVQVETMLQQLRQKLDEAHNNGN